MTNWPFLQLRPHWVSLDDGLYSNCLLHLLYELSKQPVLILLLGTLITILEPTL